MCIDIRLFCTLCLSRIIPNCFNHRGQHEEKRKEKRFCIANSHSRCECWNVMKFKQRLDKRKTIAIHVREKNDKLRILYSRTLLTAVASLSLQKAINMAQRCAILRKRETDKSVSSYHLWPFLMSLDIYFSYQQKFISMINWRSRKEKKERERERERERESTSIEYFSYNFVLQRSIKSISNQHAKSLSVLARNVARYRIEERNFASEQWKAVARANAHV